MYKCKPNLVNVNNPEIGSVESSGNRQVAPIETTTYTLRLMTSSMDDVAKELILIVRSQQQPEEKLLARIKRTGGGWRQGKGFSPGELHAAGMTDTDAVRRSIPIDMRRRSTHQVNIDTIRKAIDD